MFSVITLLLYMLLANDHVYYIQMNLSNERGLALRHTTITIINKLLSDYLLCSCHFYYADFTSNIDFFFFWFILFKVHQSRTMILTKFSFRCFLNSILFVLDKLSCNFVRCAILLYPHKKL